MKAYLSATSLDLNPLGALVIKDMIKKSFLPKEYKEEDRSKMVKRIRNA